MEENIFSKKTKVTHSISNYEFIKELEKLPFVEEIWLFGSRAREDHKERSDIDLAIVCPNAKDHEWLQVIDVIDSADTLLKIDCIRFEKKYIGGRVVP